MESEGAAETVQFRSCEGKRLLQPRQQSRVCSYGGEQVTLTLSSGRTQTPRAKWQVRTRGGQPSLASGKLGQDWPGARCSLCGDGMKCFQRNWLIVRDAKYLFDQTKLQLKKPKSLDFKSHKPGLEGAGRGEGEVRGVSSQKIVAKMSLQNTLCVSPGERRAGSHHSRQTQVLPVFQMF